MSELRENGVCVSAREEMKVVHKSHFEHLINEKRAMALSMVESMCVCVQKRIYRREVKESNRLDIGLELL